MSDRRLPIRSYGSKMSLLLRRTNSPTTNHHHPPTTTTITFTTATQVEVIQSILNCLKSGHIQKAASILFDFPLPFPHSLYAHFFRHCRSPKSIAAAHKVEFHLVATTRNPPIFLRNRALEAYAKCSSLHDAQELFDEMPQRDGGSWNALITAYSRLRYPDEAISLFLWMNKDGVRANNITFASVLGSCADVYELSLSQQVHGLVVKFGFSSNVIIGSALVDVYAKCGIMVYARRMFHEIPRPNAVTWNVIVRRYLDVGDAKEAVLLFTRMFSDGVKPLNFTFSNALVACSSMHALEEGMQIHGGVVKWGLHEDTVVSSSLINMYVKCGELENGFRVFHQLGSKDLVCWTCIVSGYAMSGKTWDARKLFDQMPVRNVISWNAMLAGYTRFFKWSEALDFVCLMLDTVKDLDHVTLGLMINVSAGLLDHEMGKQLHGFVYRHGFHSNLMVGNAILDMYGKCGNLNSARVWFNLMSNWRDRVSWNALLASCGLHHSSEQTLTMFSEMQWEAKPSKYTFGTLLAACANTYSLHLGKQIHGFIIRHEFQIDSVIRTALIYMYCKCYCLEYAVEILKGAVSRDVIMWNTLILGCCHNHRGRDALELFGIMEAEGIKPDRVTFEGILLACVEEGLVEFGTQCFESMSNEYGVLPWLEHYGCMIELYSRHGYMDELESFMKTMTIEPTLPMLERALDACQKNDSPILGKWIAKKIHEFEH
ncbi:putative pentatricopeptide [Medicago truncatula]|nr:pentatricopeptide repeat-containing protein At3g26540 [Medicago truncatula]RHN69517.1 putative pentatricopeptide [Medicago truncatula]